MVMSLARNVLARRTKIFQHHTAQPSSHRPYSSQPPPPSQPSGHAHFYSDILPGMIPVALLGSAVYLGLRLFQSSLSHERYLDEARATVRELEREVGVLREQQSTEHSVPLPAPGIKKRGWLW